MSPIVNQTVLMSGADYFSDMFAINAYMDASVPVDVHRAMADHAAIKQALQTAGVQVKEVPPPLNLQDGVYTANWGLCRGDKVVLSSLPNTRKDEEPYAEKILRELGKEIIKVPAGLKFSGQGDALPCGNFLLAGSHYRTDLAVHEFLADTLGFEVISLQAVPKMGPGSEPVNNDVTGWPDSFFYDIDLAIAVLRPDLIAWCPEAFLPESQEKIRNLPLDKIEVSLAEATEGLACNLVSTGETVVMSRHAPVFQAAVEAHGLKTITPDVHELQKGGGFIRCTTLTLD